MAMDHGTIEGRLETISQHGTYQVKVYDPLSDRGVLCDVPPEVQAQALAAFGKRVAVTGTIRYHRTGKPISVAVESMRVLGDRHLPRFTDVCGMLAGK